MIKFKDILMENTQINRIIPTKFQVAAEKLLPLLSEKDQASFVIMSNQFISGIERVNALPYNHLTNYLLRSEIVFHTEMPANAIKTFLTKHSTKEGAMGHAASCVIKALDEICYGR
jgi:hypothetical protein